MEKDDNKKSEAVQEDNWLKLVLKTPVEYQGMQVTEIDLSGLRDMTGKDLNVVYDLYSNMGGSGIVMQETSLLFAQIIASRATGYPIELFNNMRAKDAVLLKNRVYRFFFLEA